MKLQPGQRWITCHPSGEDDEGRPVLINGDGTIAAGLGGKYNGTHVAHAFGGGKGAAGVVHGGQATADEEDAAKLPVGAKPEHNKHAATYEGLKAIADTTVFGTPEGDAESGFGVHLKNAHHLADMVKAGQHTTQGGGFLTAHPDGGVMYHGAPAPNYESFAHNMAEDVITHALTDDDSEPAHEHDAQMQQSAVYREEQEREAREHYRAYQKHIRDAIRAEGGIRAERSQTEGQEKKGVKARHADEYRYLPSWAKNNAPTSPTVDQMAERLSVSFPELGVDTADDLREYLMKHQDWLQGDKAQKDTDDVARKRSRAEQRAAAKQSNLEADAAKQHAKDEEAARSRVVRDKVNGDGAKASHYLIDHPDDVAELAARHPDFDPEKHHAVRPIRSGGVADYPLPVSKVELHAKTEEAPKGALPAYVKKALRDKNKTIVKESEAMAYTEDETAVREAAGFVRVREAVSTGGLPRVPVSFMTAGPGNSVQGNTYEPAAIEALVSEIKRQPKMYISHPDDEAVRRVGHRPLQDLGGIAVRESVHYDPVTRQCVGEVIPTPAMQGYIDVAKAASDNIGVSVNAVGLCKPGTKNVVGWKKFTSADFVPQGGAGGYTRLVREAETAAYSPEDQRELNMELLKTLTLGELKAANPELYAAVVREAAASAPPAADADAVTKEQYEAVVRENAALDERLKKAEGTLHEAEVRESQRQGADLVAKTLADKPLNAAQRAFLSRGFVGAVVAADGAYKTANDLTTAVREAADAYIATLPAAPRTGFVGLGSGATAAPGATEPVREAAADKAFAATVTDWIGESLFNRVPTAPAATDK